MSIKWENKTVPLSEIKPQSYNPRKISKEQMQSLKDSLSKFDLADPIIINTNGNIIGGHQRIKALSDAGVHKVDVRYPSRELTVDEEKELNLRLNQNKGEFDLDLLIENFDQDLLKEVGFEMDFLKEAQNTEEDDFEQPDTETLKTDIKLGDIIEIGEHRLMCGDSTIEEHMSILMNGNMADIGFTSPPYNAGKNIRGNFYGDDGDNKSADEYVDFLSKCTKNTLLYTDYSFVNLQILESNKKALIEYQYLMRDNTKDILIWDKRQYPPHINPGTFGCKWEYVFAFSNNAKSRAFPANWQGKYPNVIDTENASGNEFANVHKATFPVALPSWVIEKMDFAKSVLDVFCGTGTTMVASHQLKRKCYGMELDPKYCQVIVNRMRALDDTLTVKLNGKVL